MGLVDLRGLERLPMTERARELAARLDAQRAFRVATPADDIADPIGQRAAVHEHVGQAIAEALRPLAAVLFLGTDLPDLGKHRAA
jgi:protein-tyrosine phosphatase